MTQATEDRPVRRRVLRQLGAFVSRKVTGWQRGYIRRSPTALAILAQLRRGVGKDVGAVPDLWQYTLEGLPGPEPRDDPPTRDEQAVYTALTLFAVHQQSRREEMHLPGRSLGAAVRLLRARATSADAVRRRFEALGTAGTFPEVVHHARGLITQLRAHSIPLDYGAFTDDLVDLQGAAANQVRLRWGRDFYRSKPDSDGTDDVETDSPAAGAAPTSEEAQ